MNLYNRRTIKTKFFAPGEKEEIEEAKQKIKNTQELLNQYNIMGEIKGVDYVKLNLEEWKRAFELFKKEDPELKAVTLKYPYEIGPPIVPIWFEYKGVTFGTARFT
jgi:uncharacterized protein (UPF0128 family)